MVQNQIKYANNNYYGLNISKVEEKYKVKYIGDFSILEDKESDDYTDYPVSVFYQENPKQGHSNYMGIYINVLTDVMYLCNAKTAFIEPFVGIVANNGEIVISTYRHDYNTSSDSSVFIDGGRSGYLRMPLECKKVHVIVNKNKLEVKND